MGILESTSPLIQFLSKLSFILFKINFQYFYFYHFFTCFLMPFSIWSIYHSGIFYDIIVMVKVSVSLMSDVNFISQLATFYSGLNLGKQKFLLEQIWYFKLGKNKHSWCWTLGRKMKKNLSLLILCSSAENLPLFIKLIFFSSSLLTHGIKISVEFNIFTQLDFKIFLFEMWFSCCDFVPCYVKFGENKERGSRGKERRFEVG